MSPLKNLRWLEFALDIVILFKIFISFFTATKAEGDDIEDELPKIVKMYLFNPFIGFISDMLSTIPGIVTVETINKYYYFKVIRFVHFKKLTHMIDFLADYFK
jgi:hypothetical protein